MELWLSVHFKENRGVEKSYLYAAKMDIKSRFSFFFSFFFLFFCVCVGGGG